MGKLITKQQAAEMTGLTRQTIQNWINKGVLNCIVIDKAHFLDSSTIEALSDEMKDVENTRSRLNILKLEYEKKQKEITEKIAELKELLSLFDDDELSSIRKRFYVTYPSMLSYIGIITEEEKEVLSDIIKGYSVEYICNSKNITIIQIKDIAKKAINNISKLRNYVIQRDANLLCDTKLIVELNDAHRTIELLKQELKRLSFNNFEVDSLEKFQDEFNLYKFLKCKLSDINFSTRLQTVLNDNHIETLEELITYTEKDLKQLKGLGRTCINEVKDFLDSLNLCLGCNVDRYREDYFFHLTNLRERCKALVPILNTNLEDTVLSKEWFYEELLSNNIVTIGDLASKYSYEIRNLVRNDIDESTICDFLKSYDLYLGFNVEDVYREFKIIEVSDSINK